MPSYQGQTCALWTVVKQPERCVEGTVMTAAHVKPGGEDLPVLPTGSPHISSLCIF